MLSNEQYSEQIEAYLKGELSPESASVLENEIAKNPILSNELDLQKSIINTLRESRKAELKARLNNIDVQSGTNSWWKYAAVASLVTSFGAWMYFSTSPVIKVEQSEEVNKSEEKVSYTSEGAVNNNAALAPNKEVNLEKVAKKELAAKETSSNKATKKDKKIKDQIPSLPTLNTPEEGRESAPLNKDLDAPRHNLTSTPHLGSTVAGVEVVKSKKHKFHYRYFDTKLFLYGNFDSKTYDILELNTSEGQSLYLKYENKYFSLEQNKTEVSKLEQVTKLDILNKLEEIQKK
jgi:hypothetical protein